MPRKRTVLAIAVVLVSALVSAGYPDDHAEETVKRRFQDYMEAWKKNDIETVWEIMSPHLKEGNDNSLTEFRDFVMKQGVRISGYKIGKITIEGETAIVETELQASDFHGNNLGGDWHGCKFINIDEIWYSEGCKLIAQ